MIQRVTLVIVMLIAVSMFSTPARADTIDQVNFTVMITSGPETGDTFTGSYTYDATVLMVQGFTAIESFTFTDPAWNGMTISSPGVAENTVLKGSGAFVFSAPGTATFFAPYDSFFFSQTGFIYGSTRVFDASFNDAGIGSITLGAPVPVGTTVSSPEPDSLLLLASGLLCFFRSGRK